MTSRTSDYSAPGRTIKQGSVTVYEQCNPRKMYLKAVCGGQQAVPAKLELYADGKSASKRRSLIREVSFTDIERVECNEDRDKIQIVVTMKSGSTSNGIKFNADSVEASRKWLQYCALLLTIPEYPIAECPKENYVTEKMISENSDPHRFNADKIWMVYILHEGIGDVVKMTGLHILTLHYDGFKFNLHDVKTGKCLLTWDGDKIRRSGCVKSLVFVEAGRRCRGGPGLLWMQHPIPLSAELYNCLHNFLNCHNPKPVKQPWHVCVDSAVSKSYSRSHTNYTSHQIQKNAQHSSLDDSPQLLLTSTQPPCSSDKYHSSLLNSTQNPPLPVIHDLSGLQSPRSVQTPSQHSSQQSQSSVLTPNSEKCSNGGTNDGNLRTDSYGTISETKSDAECQDKETIPQPKLTNYENVVPLKSDSIPPLPPRSINKPPLYENVLAKRSQTEVPKSSGTVPSSDDQQSSQRPSSTAQQLTAVGNQRSLSLWSKPSAVLSKSEREKLAFKRCSPMITEKLDIPAVLPYLNQQEMVTLKDYQFLKNRSITEVEKAEHLICTLPKIDGFFEKFILCLCKSKTGTGHNDIVKALTASLNEIKENNGKRSIPEPSQASKESDEPYPVFADLPDGIRSVEVKPSQTIASLMTEFSQKFQLNIHAEFEIRIGDIVVSSLEDTLRDSSLCKHIFITVCKKCDDDS